MKVRLVTSTVTDSAGSVEISRAKERGLLALLALTPGRVVSVDRLIDGLWGENPPRTAPKTLQTYIKNLRGHIASSGAARDTLRTDPPGYLLAIRAEDVDLLDFEQRCQRATTAALDDRLPEADALYHQALAGFSNADLGVFDAPGLEGAAVRFAELRRRAIDEHVDVQLQLGRHAELIGFLASQCEAEAGNERSWAQLMIALYRSGRQRDALLTFAQARDRLRDEFGLEPGAALVELETHILNQNLPAPGHRIDVTTAAPRSVSPHVPATDAVALTFFVPGASATDLERLAEQVLEPAASIEQGRTDLGYRFVVKDVDVAALVAYRLCRQHGQARIAAVAETSPAEAEAVAMLLDQRHPIVFSDAIGSSLARRRWDRNASGWAAPDVSPVALRIPSALDHIHQRLPTYVSRASDVAVDTFAQALMRGERRTLRLNGQAGVGKSTWLAHAAAVLTSRGCAVLYGQARDTDTGAHDALVDAAYQAILLLDRHELEDHVSRHGFALADLVPELRSSVGTNPEMPEAEATVAEVDAALADVIVRLGRNVPTALLIDDAPLLTDESVGLLTRLMTNPRSCGLGLILTCRSNDPEMAALAPALADLGAEDTQELSRFSAEQTARFLEATAGLDRSPRTLQVAELVNQSTLGLPLFVREMAYDLTRSGDWFTNTGKFRIDRTLDSLALPTSLHDLLTRRLAELDSEAQTLAYVGAVFGEFSTLLVATVSELPVADVLDALDRLIEQHVIEAIPGLTDHYQFAHPLLRQAALSEGGAARSAAIALAAAEFLSAQPTPTARQLDRRAELWFRAHPLAPLGRVEAELDDAARAACERSDYRRAIVHLRRRIQITESAGTPPPLSVLVSLAETSAAAQIEAGLRRRRARQAFDAATAAADADFAGRAALAFAGPFNPFGSLVTVDEESESMARQALDLGIENIELQAELWGMVAAAASDVTGASTELGTALDLASKVDNPLLTVRLLSLAHALESSTRPVGERIETNWQIIHTAQSHNERGLELQGWAWMVADAFEAGDITLMEQAAERRADLAERLNDTTYRWSDLVYQGMRATVAGRFARADALLWEALEVGRLPLADHANRFFGLQLLKLSELRGQGEPMLGPARDYATHLGYVTAFVSLAHLHAELGDLTECAELVTAHVPQDLAGLLQTYDRLPTLALLARIAQLMGDRDLGQRVAQQLTPATGQLCVHADAVLYGSVAHNLGRCALAAGDANDALRWFEDSQQTYRDLGAPAWLLLLEADICDALALLGKNEQSAERRAALISEAENLGLALRT